MKRLICEELKDLRKEIKDLRTENEQLRKFIEIGRTICAEKDLDQLIPLIMEKISKSLDSDRISFFLADWDRMKLWTKFAKGLESERINIDLKIGLVGLCVLRNQLLNVPNAYEDSRFRPHTDKITGYRTQSVLAVPFFDRAGDVIGAMQLLNNHSGLFTKEDEKKALKAASKLTLMNLWGGSGKENAEKLLHEICEATGCERGSIFLIDEEKGALRSLVAQGVADYHIEQNLNVGIAGLVALTGRDLNIEDAYNDKRFDNRTDEKTGYRTRCLLCVAIKDQSGNVLGVIEAINKNGGIFNDSDMEVLRALSSILSISIENAMLFTDQNRQFRSVLEVLAASIDAKDPLTAGHSQKVAEYSVGIARELGFGDSEIDSLSVAALLHDYGKLGIDDNVLKKPGKLTPEEYEHIKQHTKKTRSILNKMHFMPKYRDVPMVASCHHERLDGKGYFEGLKAHEIPFMAKILAVADVFEALTAKRHYREALTPEKAFEILEEGAGTQFDSNIVSAMERYWYSRPDQRSDDGDRRNKKPQKKEATLTAFYGSPEINRLEQIPQGGIPGF
jgi:HD-GYP domain-containing protein (c-di-GMP phosphodiesterase class II)